MRWRIMSFSKFYAFSLVSGYDLIKTKHLVGLSYLAEFFELHENLKVFKIIIN